MPTSRPRHAVTETPEIAEALELARRQWPDDKDRPGRLLLHLIQEGKRHLEPAARARKQQRLDALNRVSGGYDGMYEPGYLDELRAEWPE